MTHDAETVERVASIFYDSVKTALRDFDVNEEVISADVEMHAFCDTTARAALSAMPPQEVSVQEAANVLLDHKMVLVRAASWARHSEACDGGHSIVGRAAGEAAFDAIEAALRALAGETGE